MSDLESIIYANTNLLETSRSPAIKKAAKKLLNEIKADRKKRDQDDAVRNAERFEQAWERYLLTEDYKISEQVMYEAKMKTAVIKAIIRKAFKAAWRP